VNRSETIGELAKALAAAQGEISEAVKTSENPFFKSRYADLAAVWQACRPVLSKHGLAVSQLSETRWTDGKLGVCMTTILMHSSGEFIASELTLYPKVADPQGIGSAITYARRYGLQPIVGVVAIGEDDDGNQASGRGTPGHPDEMDPMDPRMTKAMRKADRAIRARDAANEMDAAAGDHLRAIQEEF